MDAARVRCTGCDFAWYGAESAHGLAVLGHCPRCRGGLSFLRTEPEPAPLVAAAGRFDPVGVEPLAPSRVLGVPLTWS